MFVIIVGGGNTGSYLSKLLIDAGHKVRVIEERPNLLEKLKAEIPEDSIIAGDGSSPSVLEQAGILHANVLAAVTGADDTNLVISSLARFEFKVPRVISRVNNPKNAWLFTPEMGVDVSLIGGNPCPPGRGRNVPGRHDDIAQVEARRVFIDRGEGSSRFRCGEQASA